MSRIGKKIIKLPSGVDVTIAGRAVTVKGSKGTLTMEHVPAVAIAREGDVITVTVADATVKKASALWGLTRALLQNMVIGVSEGFTKKLEINGIGFKAVVQGAKLILNVGYSHPVEYVLPQGVTAAIEKNVITLTGIDKQLVGETAAEIRAIKKPEPYKGKGIKYSDEVIRRKLGKVVKSAA